MTAVLIPTSSEAEWLAARRTGITASEIAVVMGLSPYSSPYALYHRKLGNLPEEPESDAMALGKHMESFVAAKFAERRPEFSLWGDGTWLYAHPERSWQMATPDRFVFDSAHERSEPLAVLECKIDGGSDEWGDDGSDQIPVHYRCQVLWQMDVLGVTTGYVACLLWNKRKVRVYELTRDDSAEADLKLMRQEASMFLARLLTRNEPAVDWRPATTDALKRLHPSLEDRDAYISGNLTRWYRAACRDLKNAQRRKTLYENRIRAVLGNGRRAIDSNTGDPVARRDVYDLPEKTITRKAATVDRLVAITPKENQ